MLWEITALVVVVYIVGGLAAFLISVNSFNKLARESSDKLTEEKAQTISSSYDYLAKAEMELLLRTYGLENIDYVKFYLKMQLADVNDLDPLQVFLIDMFGQMKEEGLLGLEYIFMVIPDPVTGEQVNFASSVRELIYLEFPEDIDRAIAEGDGWILLEDGFPRLGLEGEQLVTFSRVPSPVQEGVDLTFIGVTPMGEAVAEINGFYDREKRDTAWSYAAVTAVSLVVIIILTFFGLRYLIRKRITEPIDILSGEAEQVMEGDLDIEIVVHQGGEFEGLETAFRKMVESFRVFLARSIGED